METREASGVGGCGRGLACLLGDLDASVALVPSCRDWRRLRRPSALSGAYSCENPSRSCALPCLSYALARTLRDGDDEEPMVKQVGNYHKLDEGQGKAKGEPYWELSLFGRRLGDLAQLAAV